MEENSTSRLTLRMCHGCVYTGNFVSDCHALFLQHRRHVYRIEISYRELFRDGSVHDLYCLKALVTLEQLISSMVEIKNNLRGLLKNQDGGWRMEDRASKIADRGSVKKNRK